MSLFRKLLNSNERELRRLEPLVRKISALESEMKKLDDAELSSKTGEFRRRVANGESVDSILPEAYAVVREVSSRTLEMRHFDVQILGGIVLHQGRIAEMQTGEGKTLVATLPAYLNAISGSTVHVITVNDYLAKRDREWMGQIYRFLGLDLGLVVPEMDVAAKRHSYSCPIIYGTNTEFGFDYLRDHMALHRKDMVQGPLDYAIIDEVDSILIDEARTPLIISGQAEGTTQVYYRFSQLAKGLRKDQHYTVDEKAHIVALTEAGVKLAESRLGVDNLYSQENMELSHYLIQALKAKELMKRDVDYVVEDGEVLIVDEFTGRILLGRRFSDGLHQAIEAKEGVVVKQETDVLATITVQNFFRMYKKLAGMTGTALTEEPEFMEIYGLDVVSIPTNVPLIRTNMPDSIWKIEKAKFKAVVKEIVEQHKKGRPVLVGTISIEKSEILSQMLSRVGIPHEVLNAKHHQREAEIVAQAGRKGAVTIATNMAGRGTDILLGGNPSFMALKYLRQLECEGKPKYDDLIISMATEKVIPSNLAPDLKEKVLEARDEYLRVFNEFKKVTDKEHNEVVEYGGLHVIGTERHESRRIDNQLRGRAGRQGDPGSSRFFLSLEDDLMRLFGGDLMSSVMDKIGFSEEEPIEHAIITKSIETAQKRVEAHHFAIRKNVLEYDNVLNKQREVIYGERRKVLEVEDTREIIWDMIDKVLTRALDTHWPKGERADTYDAQGLLVHIKDLLPSGIQVELPWGEIQREDVESYTRQLFQEEYKKKAEILGNEMSNFERLILVRVVDQKWTEHLRAMGGLREGIGLRAYGQRNPLMEYQKESFELFETMVQNIQEDVVRFLYKLTVRKPGAAGTGSRPEVPKKIVTTNSGAGVIKQSTPKRGGRKTGRNEPCPCGSGKKYKNCCGKL